MALAEEDTVPFTLVKHYESCFNLHGPTPQGVDWPKGEDAVMRYKVMSELWEREVNNPIKIVDVGCGYGAFLQYLLDQQEAVNFSYTGIDLSAPMLEWAQKNYPSYQFSNQDILKSPLKDNEFDYGIMNGVFTEKLSLSFEQMESFTHQMIITLFKACRKGIAFNVMSSHVDWQRDDLFHLPLDRLVAFLTKNCSRKWIIRQDYGLYEYTVYLYH